MVMIGALAAIGIGKMTFGGLGNNIWNPALAARVFLQFAYPSQLMPEWRLPQRLFLFASEPASRTVSAAGRALAAGTEAVTAATPLAREGISGSGDDRENTGSGENVGIAAASVEPRAVLGEGELPGPDMGLRVGVDHVALGLDAYALVAALYGGSPAEGGIAGRTGMLSVDAYGVVRRRLAWAIMTGGEPELLPDAEILALPPLAADSL